MKKSIALVALAFGVTGAFAQDLTSKKGEPFLPEAGDYAIGVDATPFLNYVGNFFGKSTANNAPTFNFLNNSNLMIMGKKFVDANTAYRVGLNLNFGSTKYTNNVLDQTSTATPQAYVQDTRKVGNTFVGLTAGIEKRRGKTRLQGVYGAEAGLSFGSTKSKYAYGNTMDNTHTTPQSTDWATWNGTSANSTANGNRTTETKSGVAIGFGVRAFVGAEYFVAPKVSIGGEFGWGLGLTLQGKGSSTSEALNASGAATSTTTDTGKTSTFGLGTDNRNSVFGPSASLRLNLHF